MYALANPVSKAVDEVLTVSSFCNNITSDFINLACFHPWFYSCDGCIMRFLNDIIDFFVTWIFFLAISKEDGTCNVTCVPIYHCTKVK